MTLLSLKELLHQNAVSLYSMRFSDATENNAPIDREGIYDLPRVRRLGSYLPRSEVSLHNVLSTTMFPSSFLSALSRSSCPGSLALIVSVSSLKSQLISEEFRARDMSGVLLYLISSISELGMKTAFFASVLSQKRQARSRCKSCSLRQSPVQDAILGTQVDWPSSHVRGLRNGFSCTLNPRSILYVSFCLVIVYFSCIPLLLVKLI